MTTYQIMLFNVTNDILFERKLIPFKLELTQENYDTLIKIAETTGIFY